jgi:hypothetical protein
LARAREDGKAETGVCGAERGEGVEFESCGWGGANSWFGVRFWSEGCGILGVFGVLVRILGGLGLGYGVYDWVLDWDWEDFGYRTGLLY